MLIDILTSADLKYVHTEMCVCVCVKWNKFLEMNKWVYSPTFCKSIYHDLQR